MIEILLQSLKCNNKLLGIKMLIIITNRNLLKKGFYSLIININNYTNYISYTAIRFIKYMDLYWVILI